MGIIRKKLMVKNTELRLFFIILEEKLNLEKRGWNFSPYLLLRLILRNLNFLWIFINNEAVMKKFKDVEVIKKFEKELYKLFEKYNRELSISIAEETGVLGLYEKEIIIYLNTKNNWHNKLYSI